MTWYDSDWQYRKTLTISASGVAGSSLEDFPVLLHTQDSDLKNGARSDGRDIFFTSTSGVLLAHDRLYYGISGTIGELYSYVNIPFLTSGVYTDIYMYYGNSLAADQQDKPGTWDDNYIAVLNLGESGDGTPYEYLDSTGNGHDGRGGGIPPVVSGIPTRIDQGDPTNPDHLPYSQLFDEDLSDIIQYPHSGVNFTSYTAFTAQGLFRNISSPDAGDDRLYGHCTATGTGDQSFLLRKTSTTQFGARWRTNTNTNPTFENNAGADKVWEWHTVTWDSIDTMMRGFGGNPTIWDGETGVEVLAGDNMYDALGIHKDSIGSNNALTRNYNGQVGYARISKVARSEDYLKTLWNFEANSDLYWSLGDEVTKTESPIRIVQVALRTTVGTQDIVITGTGDCKGYLIFCNLATVNGTETDGASLSIGIVDGSGTVRSVAGASEHNQAISDAFRRQDTSSVIYLLDHDGTIEADVSHDSFITDGIRISVDTAPPDGKLCTVWLLYGSSTTTKVATLTTSSVDDTEVLVTVGQQTKLLLAIRSAQDVENTTGTSCLWNFGVAYKDSSSVIHNWGLRVLDLDGQDPSNQRIGFGKTLDFNGVTTVTRAYDVTTLSSTQVGITTRLQGVAGVNRAYYLMSINFGSNIGVKVDMFDQPISTGDKTITGVGFQPSFVAQVMSQTTVNIVEGGSLDLINAGSFYIGAADGNGSSCIGVHTEDNQVTTDTGSFTDDQAVATRSHDGTVLLTGTHSTFDSDGYTWNYTTVPGAAFKGFYIAVEGILSGADQGYLAELVGRQTKRRLLRM